MYRPDPDRRRGLGLSEPVALVAVDWGTTNRRGYALSAAGAVLQRHADARGILAVAAGAFATDYEALRAALDGPDAPALLAGMVGSRSGWVEAPYAPAPATLADLATRAVPMPGATGWIAPGVADLSGQDGDVMRGEELQVFGALSLWGASAPPLLCLPGTHTKWVFAHRNVLERFRTVPSGEVFDTLAEHGLLSRSIDRHATHDRAAFLTGVRRATGGNDLLAALFGARARHLLHEATPAWLGSYVRGLMVGEDVRIAYADARDAGRVGVIGRPELVAAYAAALEGIAEAVPLDGEAAFCAGAAALMAQLR